MGLQFSISIGSLASAAVSWVRDMLPGGQPQAQPPEQGPSLPEGRVVRAIHNLKQRVWQPYQFRPSMYHYYRDLAQESRRRGEEVNPRTYIDHGPKNPLTRLILDRMKTIVPVIHEQRTRLLQAKRCAGGRRMSRRPRFLEPSVRVLEVGAAEGKLSQAVKGEFKNVVDVTAIELVPYTGVPDFVRQGDMEALPFQDGLFHIVLSSFAMDGTNGDKAFQEVNRVLMPDGHLLALVLKRSGVQTYLGKGASALVAGSFWLTQSLPFVACFMPRSLTLLWEGFAHYARDIPRFGFSSLDETRSVLERHGLVIQESQPAVGTKWTLSGRTFEANTGWFVVAKKTAGG